MVQASEIKLPVTLKDKLLFSAGYWNNLDIQPSEIVKAFDNTKWDLKKTQSLYFEHRDSDATEWTGNVINARLDGQDVYGDLEIWDPVTAIKLDQGKAPFAISAKIHWPSEYNNPIDFEFDNFSLVADPGVAKEEIYINFNKEQGNKSAKFYITEDLTTTERRSNLNGKNMEKEKNEQNKAKFSMEEFTALVARVSKLESSVAKFSEEETKEEESKEEAPVEEAKEEVVEEAKEEAVEDNAEESKEETEEEAEEEAEEEKSEEAEEEAKPEEESKEEEASEDAKEEEATFSNEVVTELKAIKAAIGKSAVGTTGTLTKKAGFSAAIDRLEKELI